MGNTLSFPGLGLEFEINQAAFQLGGITIYWYGVIIAFAFLAGITYVLYRVKSFGLDGDRAVDVILGASIGAIVGARLYYVVFSGDTYGSFWDIINIRQGGIAIYGGIIGGFLVGLLMCKIRKVRFLPMADLAVGGLILGQAIGRWGNFVNMEAFGGNTNLPWGMTSQRIQDYLRRHASSLSNINMPVDPTIPVHPTFFYESLWCLLGFIAIFLFTKRRRFDGELVLLYAVWYGLGRSVIEGLRTDSLLIGTLRVSQVLAILCVIICAIVWIVVRSKIKRNADPGYLMLYVNTQEGQSVLAGTFYKKKGQDNNEEGLQDTPDQSAQNPDRILGNDTISESIETEDALVTENHITERQEPVSTDGVQKESGVEEGSGIDGNRETEETPLDEKEDK